MFGKISDKTKRDAYLKALSQERAIVEQENLEQDEPEDAESQNIQTKDGRVVVSGKEAVRLASQDLNISGDHDEKAIIANQTADMGYYANWRSRIDGEHDEKETQTVSQNQGLFSRFESRQDEIDDGDENGREPGVDGNETTLTEQEKRSSSKAFLESLMPSSTREEGEVSTDDILNSLFSGRKLFDRPHRSEAYDFAPDTEPEDNTPGPRNFINRNLISAYARSKSLANPETQISAEPEDDISLDAFEEEGDVAETNGDILADDADFADEDEAESAPEPKKYEAISRSYINGLKPRYQTIEKPKTEKKAVTKTEPKPRKKKKKFDADIGAGGFFTVR